MKENSPRKTVQVKKIFPYENSHPHRACPTNGSDCGSLRDHNLTLLVALVYLGRYLYRGVIQEKDILSHNNGRVTFRYQNSQTKQIETRTLGGVEFLRLILQHILPKGYRRARNFVFLHPNSKLIPLVQLRKRVVLPTPQPRPAIRCKCCGGVMKIIRTRIKIFIKRLRTPASDREMVM